MLLEHTRQLKAVLRAVYCTLGAIILVFVGMHLHFVYSNPVSKTVY